MSLRTLQTLDSLFTRDDGRLDIEEAQRLVDASRDEGLVGDDERAMLSTVARAPRTTASARDVLEKFLAQPAANSIPVILSRTGPEADRFEDDQVILGPDGSVRGHAGVTPYSRSYDAVHTGPMRLAHGSPAPRSTVLTADEARVLTTQTPAQALDRAAVLRGVALDRGFVALAESKSSWDPQAPSWWGKCHAWAWSALSSELSARVDVGGPEGQRGLWLSGQWISRADLGNFLMGVADRIALADPNVMFRGTVSPIDLLSATTQFLVEGGGGFVADLHNDAVHGGEREVWNQPFVAADVDTTTLEGDAAKALLALAAKEGTPGVAVKHVHVVGRYGNERSDGWEGPADLSSRSWNVYAVTNTVGAVVAAYLADDAKLDGLKGLPTRSSHELPEYVWKPSLRAVESALEGRRDPAVDQDPLAREYRFFVGAVLTQGVPGSMRAAFEAEVAALPAGPIALAKRDELRAKYPGVAEAYTPEQWARAFGSRGL